jgi:hypothetical protein
MLAAKHHEGGSGHHHPVQILHRGEHRLFLPSDNLDALFKRRLEDDLQLRIFQHLIGCTKFRGSSRHSAPDSGIGKSLSFTR